MKPKIEAIILIAMLSALIGGALMATLQAQGIIPNCGTVTNGMNFTIVVSGPAGQPMGRVSSGQSRRFCVGR